jgi:hypothetical protein
MPRPVTSFQHAVVDYVLAAVIIASPWIFGFADISDPAARTMVVLAGVFLLLQAALTDYDISVLDVLPLRPHLANDAVIGILLITSPFILGFRVDGTKAWLPHVVFGVVLVALAVLTREHRGTAHDRRRSAHPAS